MSKRQHVTLRERLRRLRDRANARPDATPTSDRPQQQYTERASGVYPAIKRQPAWLTMRRSNGNANEA